MTDQISEFWERCRRFAPREVVGNSYVVRRMGNAPAIGETLLRLVASGEKTGMFSRPMDLERAGIVPQVGDFVIFTDHDDRPRSLVRMEECRLMKFSDVGPAQTACESPAARDVDVWRGIHRRYWAPVLAAEGGSFSEDMPILFQRFRLIYAET